MKPLFNRVYDGLSEMFEYAEGSLEAAIAELGEDEPVNMPETAYYCACSYAYLGKKITKLGELKEALQMAKDMFSSEKRTAAVFRNGIATVICSEVMEVCKYVRSEDPYKNTVYHGHFSDAEVRELGVPLVTGDIPGFVVIIDKAPSDEKAAELIKGYQSRGIFVFLIGRIIDQAKRAGVQMGFPVRVVAVGQDIWTVSHVISLVVRAAMIFGAIEPGDWDGFMEYTFVRIRAFVNAFKPVHDITVAHGAGAIAMGFPVITNDTADMWPVPKSLLIQEDFDDLIETSLEARDIKIKITNIDIPIAFSSAFEGEIVRKADTQLDIDGSRLDTVELVEELDASEIEDHSIEVIGPEADEFEPGSKINYAVVVQVCGKNFNSDFEPVIERKFHEYINKAEGIMHTGRRDMLRIRISKTAYEAGFRIRHLGEILYAKVKSDYDAIVDKCQVRIYTEPEKCKEIRAKANVVFDKRDERLATLTDENVDQFYTCIMCQAFSPSHVCIVTPERLGLCGAVSWFDAKATNELDPTGPCQIVTKERLIDERIGTYEDVDEAVNKYSHGALEHVSLYSILEDPMTSCGCFECICGIEPMTSGFAIVNREHTGMTPLGMTFSEMASMTGGGVQTPGYMGHGKHFIASKKFLKAEGGVARIVWMPKALKEVVRTKLDKTANELYGIENFTDMIADETVMQDCADPEELMNFLAEVGHPVLEMEPLL